MASFSPNVSASLIPTTRFLLKFYGVNFNGSNRLHRYIIKPLVNIYFLVFIGFHVTSLINNCQVRFLVDAALILHLASQIILPRVIDKTNGKIFEYIQRALKILTKDELQEIRNREKRYIIATVIFTILEVVAVAVYCGFYGGKEILFIFYGLEPNNSTMSGTTPFGLLTSVTFFYTYVGILTDATYFVAVLHVLIQYGRHCSRTLKQLGKSALTGDRLKKIQGHIDFQIQFLNCINDSLGIIPFLAISVLFGFVTSGFSFVILNDVAFTIPFTSFYPLLLDHSRVIL